MAAKKRGQPKGSRAAKKQRREAASRSIDQRVVKALSHPLRVEILAILNDRMASPNELSKALEEGLSQVSYHVKVLKDFDMIEMVKTEPRRGAVEHYYRASAKVFIPSEQLKLMPKSAQVGVWAPVMSDIEQDVNTSLGTGTFAKRSDLVVGRDPRILDGKAREDAEELAAEFFERWEQLEVDTERRQRNGEGDGQSIPTTAVVLVLRLGGRQEPETVQEAQKALDVHGSEVEITQSLPLKRRNLRFSRLPSPAHRGVLASGAVVSNAALRARTPRCNETREGGAAPLPRRPPTKFPKQTRSENTD